METVVKTIKDKIIATKSIPMYQALTRNEIISKTAQHPLTHVAEHNRAAVLIPLLDIAGELFVLFEIRNARITQGGDICFPGGKIEPGETPEEAAVRETSEELLIHPQDIDILAPMHVIEGPRSIEVTSYLGQLHNYKATYAPDEIDHIIIQPLSFFMETEPVIWHTRQNTEVNADLPEDLRKFTEDKWTGAPRDYYFYRTERGIIWGLTAKVMYYFVKCLKEKKGR